MENKNDFNEEEKPPILKSWNRIYFIVFLNLIILMILFYWFTVTFE